MLIPLKEMRLNKFAPIAATGSHLVQSHQVEMTLDTEKGLIYARRISNSEVFAIPVVNCDYIRPTDAHAFDEYLPVRKPAPKPVAPPPVVEVDAAPVADVVVFEKRDGQIVEVKKKK